MTMATTDKQKLRRTLEDRLTILTAADVALASEAICDRLWAHETVQQAAHLACFSAFGWEVDLSRVADRVLAAGGLVYYPRFRGRGQGYEMARIDVPTRDLAPGYWGILEPRAGLPAVDEDLRRQETFVWLVPGMAFDRRGHRLGRGAGYYDRLLTGCRGPRIGVAHDCQVVPDIPVEPHDVLMNEVITDRQTINCRPDSETEKGIVR